MDEKTITLDGKVVTLQELEEAKQAKATRIIETAPGEYKTLQHLKESA